MAILGYVLLGCGLLFCIYLVFKKPKRPISIYPEAFAVRQEQFPSKEWAQEHGAYKPNERVVTDRRPTGPVLVRNVRTTPRQHQPRVAVPYDRPLDSSQTTLDIFTNDQIVSSLQRHAYEQQQTSHHAPVSEHVVGHNHDTAPHSAPDSWGHSSSDAGSSSDSGSSSSSESGCSSSDGGSSCSSSCSSGGGD